MTDVFSPAKRSAIMARIKGKNTSPEVRIRRLLHALGYRFRLHYKKLPGQPDIVLPRFQKVILVHGCFWHGHVHCTRSGVPSSNADFWTRKIESNRKRDQRIKRQLRRLGWAVLEIWQCQIADPEALRKRLLQFLQS